MGRSQGSFRDAGKGLQPRPSSIYPGDLQAGGWVASFHRSRRPRLSLTKTKPVMYYPTGNPSCLLPMNLSCLYPAGDSQSTTHALFLDTNSLTHTQTHTHTNVCLIGLCAGFPKAVPPRLHHPELSGACQVSLSLAGMKCGKD